MSLMYRPVQSVQLQDPRLQIASTRSYTIERGASQATYTNTNAVSYSNTQIQFQVLPTNKKTVIDRHVRLIIPVQFTIAGTDQGGKLFQRSTGMNALRTAPVSAVTNSLTLSLNGAVFTYNISDSIHALQWYQNDEATIFGDSSLSPMMPDQSQDYGGTYGLTGSSRNPLNSYADGMFWENPRGELNTQFVYSTDTNTSTVFTATIVEDVYLSPLLFAEEMGSGFVGVNDFQLTLQLGDLTRMLSHNSDGYTFSSISASIGATPQILVCQLTPQVDEPIPEHVSWGYSNVTNYITSVGNVNAGASATVPTSNIQLSAIPQLIYVFARRRNADRTYLTTDSFANITNINITFANKSGILGSATQYDLYNISRRNGIKMSWVQWKSYVGSVLCLDVARDLGLDPLQAPGLAGWAGNFQMNVTFNNISGSTINYDLYVCACVDGVLTMSNGNFFQQVGVLTAQDIFNSSSLPILPSGAPRTMYGGSFWDSFKKGFSMPFKWIWDNKKDIIDTGKQLAPILPMVGLGEDGGALVGGKKLSKASLRARYSNY